MMAAFVCSVKVSVLSVVGAVGAVGVVGVDESMFGGGGVEFGCVQSFRMGFGNLKHQIVSLVWYGSFVWRECVLGGCSCRMF